jgi:hypothetical protein
VVLGVGHSNTSITTRQLTALGWQLGDADDQWCESVSIRNLNEALLKGKWSRAAAAAALQALPQPWAIKDPRFVHTLPRWLAVLGPYRPLLLWITKDEEAVRRSYQRRGERTDSLAAKLKSAARQFEAWPFEKLQLAAEDIARASLLIDPERMAYALRRETGIGELPIQPFNTRRRRAADG